jgi:signal peptidase I
MSTWPGVLLAVAVLGAGVVAGLRAALVLVTVVGSSMAPTLEPGDRVVVLRRWLRPASAGDIVAARFDPAPPGTPGRERADPWIIKRVAALGGHPVPGRPGAVVAPGTVYLLGDNAAASDDSRLWGCLPVTAVVGVVIRRMPRAR